MQKPLPNISPARREAVDRAADLIDGELPGRRDPIRWLVGCGILLIAAIAIGTVIMVGNFREQAIESSKRELENTVWLLAHHFDQQLGDAEVPLNDIIAQAQQAGIASADEFKRQMSATEVHMLLKARVGDSHKIAGFNIYDAAGDLINSSEVEVVPAVNISDRAYFRTLKSSPEVPRPRSSWCRAGLPGIGKR
jgi:hypothetical protein